MKKDKTFFYLLIFLFSFLIFWFFVSVLVNLILDKLVDIHLKNKSERYLQQTLSKQQISLIDEDLVAVIVFDNENFYQNSIVYKNDMFDMKDLSSYPKIYKYNLPNENRSILFVYKETQSKFRFALILQFIFGSALFIFILYFMFILKDRRQKNILSIIESIRNGKIENKNVNDEFYDLFSTVNEIIKKKENEIERLKGVISILKDQNFSLKEMDSAKSSVIENISHELKTPLTKIKGYLEYMYSEKMGELQPSQKDALTVVIKNVNSILNQIDKIIKYAKSEYINLEREIFDLKKVLKDIVDTYIPIATEKNIKIVLDASNLETPIYADRNALIEAFDNIINNALKFTQKDGNITITGYEKMDNNNLYAVIRVEDTGIGIPADKIDKIFDRFYQVEQTSSKKYPGMGLGLAIVKTIVNAHNGTIDVSSVVGKGTNVKIVLPLKVKGGENEAKR
ncbi:MAG: HAMP domain-containing sensor histidine kinase [candidate division WOR-3 bacterium]